MRTALPARPSSPRHILGTGPRPRRWLSGALVVTLLATGLSALGTAPAQAAVVDPFTQTFSANTTGDVLLRGNSLLTCPTAAPGCTAARARTGTGVALNNNSYAMVVEDVDGDPSTTNSSTAQVQLPATSTVLFAGLYWGADTSAGAGGVQSASQAARGTVRVRTPASGYQTVTATQLSTLTTAARGPYQGYADVTTLVRAGGSGTYGVGNVVLGTGQDRYAGWALVIAYGDPTEPVRNLTVFDGFASVVSGETITIPVSGFQTPPSGTVRTRIGAVTYEGDAGSTGDQLLLGTRTISDAQNPATNVFNSTISDLGSLVSTRTPSSPNTFGIDVDRVLADGALPNGATSASLRLTSTSETYYPGVVTFATELYSPKVTPTKTVTDVDGGNVEPGDVLQYEITATNSGQDAATELVLTDQLPAGVAYVPGSLSVGGTARTDAADPDTGEAVASGGSTRVVVRLGTGAGATTGGRVAVGATSATVRFQVVVDPAAADASTVTNLATTTYAGEQTGLRFSSSSAPVTNEVTLPRSDLRLRKTGTPTVVQRGAGTPVTYSFQVVNDGPRPEAAAVLTDVLPAGLTVTAATSSSGTCTTTGTPASGQTVTCQLGALAVGQTVTVSITAVPGADAPAQATDTATVVGRSVDPDPADSTASATTTVNAAPVATGDTASTGTGQPVVVTVLSGDSDPDGDPLTVSATVGVPPSRGSTTVNPDGTVTYTPDPGFAGTDAFDYTVSDGRGGSATARVTVTVANAAPVAGPDSAGTPAATAVDVAVLANDTDPNIPGTAQVLTVEGATVRAAQGTVVLLGGGVLRFTPAAAFRGTAVVSYVLVDGAGGSTTGTLSVEVSDAAPVALDDEAATDYLTPVSVPVLANDSDPNGDPLTITAFPPTLPDATVALVAGRLVVTPRAGFSGATVVFDYTVSAGGLSDTATVRVLVRNAPVTAVDDEAEAPTRDPLATGAYPPVTVALTVNDSNPDGDVLDVVGVGDPAHGTVVVSGTTASYVPDAGYRGPDSFTYTVRDGKGSQSTATVRVSVLNAAPVVTDDTRSVVSGATVTVPVLADDRDPNADPLTVVGVPPTSREGGTVTVVDGRIVYTAPPGFRGDDVVAYRVSDGLVSTPAVLSITVVNSPPVATDDAVTTSTTQPLTIQVITGGTPDSDLDADVLTVESVTAAGRGAVTISADGRSVSYDPDPDFTGTDTFTYVVTDSRGGTDTATVTVTVTNRSPRTVPDSVQTARDTPVTISPLTGDTDPDGDVVTLSGADATTAAGGTVVVGAAGTVTYTPPTGYTGTDTFGYDVSDGRGGTSRGTVTVLVPNGSPEPDPDAETTASGTPVDVDVLAGDTDPDGDPLRVLSVTTPTSGSASVVVGPDGRDRVRYTPALGAVGPATFDYVVGDGRGGTGTATVTVTVANAPPVARDNTAGTAPGTAVRVAVVADDTDVNVGPTTQRLSVAAVGPVTGPGGTPAGVAVVAPDDDTVVVLTPAPGFQGLARFTYDVTDGAGGIDRATVSVLVDGARPSAVTDAATTASATAVSVDVVDNDTDPNPEDVPGLRVQPGSVSDAVGGTAVLQADGRTVLFTPAAATVGEATFRYRVVDPTGAVSDPVTVVVDVANAVPVARDDAATTGRDTTLVLPAAALTADDTDANGDVLRLLGITGGLPGSAVSLDDRGTPDPADDVIRYTPPSGFTGTDVLTYTVGDGRGGTASADLVVTVPNRAPVADDDDATTPSGTTLELRVADDDTDPDGDPLTVVGVGPASEGGAIVLSDSSTVRFTPAAGFAGVARFTYTISDGRGGLSTATVRVTVLNAPPVARDDTAGTAPATPVDVDVLANDTDVNSAVTGQVLRVLSVGPAPDAGQGGQVVLRPDGRVRYTPGAGTQGLLEVPYTITDGEGGRATAVIRVLVDGARPSAVSDQADTPPATALALDLVANDTDPNPVDRPGLRAVDLTPPLGPDGTSAGTAVLEADGRTLTFTPDPAFAGVAELTYVVIDPGGLRSEPAVVLLTVANALPVARDDAASTPRDTTLTLPPGTLRANDTDANGDVLRIVGVTGGAPGSSVLLVDPGTPDDPRDDQVRYTPPPGFTGTDELTYTVADGRGGTASARVLVTVPNLAPSAADDSASVPTDGVVVVDVLLGDSDPDGDPLTVTGVSVPTHGDASVVDGRVRYAPRLGYAGPDSVVYTISDGRGGTATATLTVTVLNARPIAGDDVAGTAPGAPVVVDVLTDDRDANLGATSQVLTVVSVTQPAAGSVVIAADGRSVVFTPAAGQQGSAVFSYTVSDGTTGPDATDTAAVLVVIDGQRPQASPDTAETPTGRAVLVPVLADDRDPNDDPLSVGTLGTPVDSETGAVAGSVQVQGTQVLFTPAPGYAGTVTFTYTARDDTGLDSLPAVVTVTVLNAVPVAVDDTATTGRDVPLVFAPGRLQANDTDANGDPLTVVGLFGGAPGSALSLDADGRVVYVPPPGFTGVDTFGYVVDDGRGGRDRATVTVTVPDAAPVATDDVATTPAATPVEVEVTANDTDPDGDTVLVTRAGGARHGDVVVLDARTVRYTPDLGFAGVDTFTYTISDGRGGTDVATVGVTVENAPPVAVDDRGGTAPGTRVTFDVLGNDRDDNVTAGVPGQSLRVESVTPPASGGTVEILPGGAGIAYTPSPGVQGPVVLSYVVGDGAGGTDVGLVFVLVDGEAPAAFDDAVTTGSGAPVAVDVLANDTDPNPADRPLLRVTVVSGPSLGTLLLASDGTGTYRPRPESVGVDEIVYEVRDPSGRTAQAVLRITVRNAAPVAVDDPGPAGPPFATDRDVPLVFVPGQLRGNDSDVNGDALVIVGVAGGRPGSIVVLDDRDTADPADDTVVYTPPPGFTGVDTFTYTISDGRGGHDSATVRLTVRNAAPTASDDTAVVDTDGTVLVDVRDGDVDPDGDPLTVTGVSSPASGTTALQADGTVRYTPDPGYAGPDTFDYLIDDGRGGTATATVFVTVRNALPVARPDTAGTAPGQPVTVAVLANDTDANTVGTTQELRVSAVTQPSSGGTATVTADGLGVRLVPTVGSQGPVSFTYTVSDGVGGSATQTVTVLVDGARPAGTSDAVTVPAGAATEVDVLANDTDPNGDPLSVQPSSLTPLVDGTGTVVGTVEVTPGGRVLVIPAAGFCGPATFRHRAIDDGGPVSNLVEVSVTVANRPPVLTPDIATVRSGGAVVVDVLGNDADPDGDALTVVGIETSVPGTTVTVGPDGRVTYRSAPGFVGTDVLRYTVADEGGGRTTSTLTITVTAAPTPPGPTPPGPTPPGPTPPGPVPPGPVTPGPTPPGPVPPGPLTPGPLAPEVPGGPPPSGTAPQVVDGVTPSRVRHPVGPSDGRLARTGSDLAVLALQALLLIGLGVALVLGSRRRPDDAGRDRPPGRHTRRA